MFVMAVTIRAGRRRVCRLSKIFEVCAELYLRSYVLSSVEEVRHEKRNI